MFPDTSKALEQVAAWFADEIIGNEWEGTLRREGVEYTLPAEFRRLVAQRMVENAFLGWPDMQAANDTLAEFCRWDDEAPEGEPYEQATVADHEEARHAAP